MAKIVMSHKYIAVAEPLYDLIISDLQVIGLRQKCVSACEFFNPIFDPDEPQLVLDTFPRFLLPILPTALELLSINLVNGPPDIFLGSNQAVALLECFNYLCSDQGFTHSK
ncbi:hypothetical protein EBR57_03570 [bacterium]|nr:hypothetical protein [bacterium]